MYSSYSVIDIETDGLLDTATKIHCLCAHKVTPEKTENLVFTDVADMRNFLKTEILLIGHNICRFDLPALEMLLGIEINTKFVDTLALSWYLFPLRTNHGLEDWGENLGIDKPPVVDWKNEPVEVYIHRCIEDTKINSRLLIMMMGYLMEIYEYNFSNVVRLIEYLMFKMECAREQEEVRWKLDIEKCRTNLGILLVKQEEQKEILKSVMPRVRQYKQVARPKVCYKKDGTPSVHGQAWLDLLRSLNLPDYHVGTLLVEIDSKEPNPNSPAQIKDWLFSLGWKPDVYKYVKHKKTGAIKKVPQINDEGEITDSVAALYDIEPNIKELEGLSILQHRIGILQGFLENVSEDGYVKAEISGFTNTLRFKHTVVVNLPTIFKPYGDLIRGCLTVPDGYILCGADMSGLEDSTKRHYMFYFDPGYVNEQLAPDFDPHLDLALIAGMVTSDDVDFFKNYVKEVATPAEKERYAALREIRVVKGKKTNFTALYGGGAEKISLAAKIPLVESKALHTAYWVRNKAVKEVAAACITKSVRHQDWLYNPVSRLWYSLRAEKDKFSTLNQGTAVRCFDTWVFYVRRQGVKICGQFHDEIAIPLPEEDQGVITQVLNSAIQDTNAVLQLNVPLRISIDFGHNYAETH